MRPPAARPLPIALAVGLLEDGGRALFTEKTLPHAAHAPRGAAPAAVFELPGVLIFPGEDPTARLRSSFAESLGLDVQVHGVTRESTFNAGSRKHKHTVPVLVFKVTAKNTRAKEGVKARWLPLHNLRGIKLSRNTEWLRA